MRSHIKIGIAALTIGTALMSVPAFAQTAGRSVNDGGLVTGGDYYPVQKNAGRQRQMPTENAKQGDYYAPEAPQQQHSGRPMNDGGMQ
jgi:hypothetical protein